MKILSLIANPMSLQTCKSFVRRWNTIYDILDENRDACNCPIYCQVNNTSRAVQLIACDFHVHLVSKAGSVIGGKSLSPVFKWSGS